LPLNAVLAGPAVMIRVVGLVMILAFASVAAPAAHACSCIARPTAETFKRASLVFKGELVAAAPHPSDACGDETLTFLPSKIWKGEISGPVIAANASVGRHRDGSLPARDERVCLKMCPVFVEQRKEYIVFLFSEPLRLQYCHSPLDTGHEVATKLQRELDVLADKVRRPKKRAG
jgi:hypothetical protein